MDFLDPKKKRAHSIRLYIGYFLMVIVVSTVALLLVFYAYGYNLNLKTGDITQNGLVFVDAHPETANVYVNGQLKGRTDQRLILPSDNYTVELQREGYRSWQSSFALLGGKIKRLVYPFLFPEKLITNETQLYAAKPPMATQSPDRRWLIVGQPNGPLTLSLADLNTEIASSATLNLPPNLFTAAGAKHDVEAVEWSTDNRHVVLRHAFDGGVEFLLIDREVPGNSQNLSRVFSSVAFSDIALRDKRFDRYYLHNKATGVLMAAELAGGAPSPVLNGVLQFKPHGDDVLLYVTKSGATEGHALARVREGDRTYTIHEVPSGSKYLLDIARFSNSWYMAVGEANDGRVYVLRDPVDILNSGSQRRIIPAGLLRLDKPEFVSFSANARFVGIQSGSNFAVYDAENDKSYRYDTELELAAGQKATWMDGHRLTLVSKKQLHVFDFDGTNRQALSSSYSEFPPYFNSVYSAVFTLTDSEIKGRAALLRTELIVEPEN